MKITLSSFLILLLFSACSITPTLQNENYNEVLNLFKENCKTQKAQTIYGDLCSEASKVSSAQEFMKSEFVLSRVDAKEGLLTGYYEPELHGSYTQSDKYPFPIYETPNDLVVVDLGSVYPKLKNYRLRGRIENHKLVPYYSRLELSQREIDANVICYTDSKIDLFFLEVQGSGRVKLDNGETVFIGYDNQNGHPYKSIGKYLIELGEITQENISLQSIKQWFAQNPARVEEILNHNPSVVFFKKREQGATGALGLELTPLRSVAVDKRYTPLGSMLFLSAEGKNHSYHRVVFAQDTGGAIKGKNRADLFLGFGENAGKIAGELQAPLKMWVFTPKKGQN